MASSRPSAARAAVDLTFEELYRGHRADVYRAALRELGNAHDAEDVTQAAFVDAYKAVLRGTQPQSPRAWLLAISENVRKRRYRTAQRRPHELPLDADFPLAAELPTEQAHALAEALAALPPEQRRVFVFREIVGLSYEEIATRVDSTVASVQMLLFRARRSLRDVLDPPVVSRRKGALVPIPGWLTGLASRFELAGVTPRVVGATGATALAVLGSSVAVPQAPADVRPPSRAAVPTPQLVSAPAKVAAGPAARRSPAPRAPSPRLRPPARMQTAKGSKPTAAAAPPTPAAAAPVATAAPELAASPTTVSVVPTTTAIVPAKPVVVPLPVPGVLPPQLTNSVPDVQLPVDPQQVVPKLPVPVPALPPTTEVVEVAAGAAGAAGASAPPLPVPSLPPVALPQAP